MSAVASLGWSGYYRTVELGGAYESVAVSAMDEDEPEGCVCRSKLVI